MSEVLKKKISKILIYPILLHTWCDRRTIFIYQEAKNEKY